MEKEHGFGHEVLDDGLPVTPALEFGVDADDGDVGVPSAAGELLVFLAKFNRAESNTGTCGIPVNPSETRTEKDFLRMSNLRSSST